MTLKPTRITEIAIKSIEKFDLIEKKIYKNFQLKKNKKTFYNFTLYMEKQLNTSAPLLYLHSDAIALEQAILVIESH